MTVGRGRPFLRYSSVLFAWSGRVLPYAGHIGIRYVYLSMCGARAADLADGTQTTHHTAPDIASIQLSVSRREAGVGTTEVSDVDPYNRFRSDFSI